MVVRSVGPGMNCSAAINDTDGTNQGGIKIDDGKSAGGHFPNHGTLGENGQVIVGDSDRGFEGIDVVENSGDGGFNALLTEITFDAFFHGESGFVSQKRPRGELFGVKSSMRSQRVMRSGNDGHAFVA